MLKINNLRKVYKNQKGLHQFSLEVKKGEVVAILGKNGAGKTTMIESMLEWRTPDSGEVEFLGGLSLKKDRENILQRIGFVNDQPNLVEEYTVKEMIEFVCGFYAFWDFNYQKELQIKFRLEDNQIIKDMSRGMKAKLGLLLVLSYKPDLLILDEATNGLDPKVREEVMEMMVTYVAEEQKAVIYATHLLDEAARIATHTVIIDEGNTLFEATMDKLSSAVFCFEPKKLSELSEIDGVRLFEDEHKRKIIADASHCEEEVAQKLKTMGGRYVDLEELFLTMVSKED